MTQTQTTTTTVLTLHTLMIHDGSETTLPYTSPDNEVIKAIRGHKVPYTFEVRFTSAGLLPKGRFVTRKILVHDRAPPPR